MRLAMILVLLILCYQTAADAEQLYRWREADGSLTFSPTPPPKGSGIAFETVSGGSNGSHVSPQSTAVQTPPATTSAAPLTYAPPVTSALAVPSAAAENNTPITVNELQINPQTVFAGDKKNQHCAELRKRVVSLERLITTDISNDTMDNAVVQMARYQNSFNQACRGFVSN